MSVCKKKESQQQTGQQTGLLESTGKTSRDTPRYCFTGLKTHVKSNDVYRAILLVVLLTYMYSVYQNKRNQISLQVCENSVNFTP